MFESCWISESGRRPLLAVRDLPIVLPLAGTLELKAA